MTDNTRAAAAQEQARDNMTDEEYRSLLKVAGACPWGPPTGPRFKFTYQGKAVPA